MLKLSFGISLGVLCGMIAPLVFSVEPRVDYNAFNLPTDLKPGIIVSEDGVLPSDDVEISPVLVEQEQEVEVVTEDIEPVVETEVTITEDTVIEVTDEQVVVSDVAETEVIILEEPITETESVIEEKIVIVEPEERSEVTPEIIIETEQANTAIETELVEVVPEVSEQQEQEVDEDLIILNWATAWSNNDTEVYLSFYADNFVPANSELDRVAWEALRRKRLENQDIRIVVSNAELYRAETDNIEVRFTQRYSSKNYRDRVIKAIEMIRTENGWKFVSERVIEKLSFE